MPTILRQVRRAKVTITGPTPEPEVVTRVRFILSDERATLVDRQGQITHALDSPTVVTDGRVAVTIEAGGTSWSVVAGGCCGK